MTVEFRPRETPSANPERVCKCETEPSAAEDSDVLAVRAPNVLCGMSKGHGPLFDNARMVFKCK